MIATRDAFGALEPIGLDELVARASLLARVDRKYILPAADLPFVVGGLPAGVRVLELGGRREFDYRSVYFDTPDLDSYLATARRRSHRFKVRIRSYLDSGEDFLEVKTRGGRGVTVKHRVPHQGGRGRLGPAGCAYAEDVLATAGVRCDTVRFRPALTTHYRRTTLFVATPGSRVTVDTALGWALPDGTRTELPGRVIVETKSGRAASDVDRLLWSMGHRPCAVSKYGTGLAALRPDLPANHWHPVLRRHFRPADTNPPTHSDTTTAEERP